MTGPVRPQVFTDAEFAARLGRVQTVMAERSLAALVVADPANLYYLTGYNAWSFYTPQCLVVPATGLPHLFARAMDAHGGHHTANLDQDHIHGYPEHLVHRPDVHPFEWIAYRACSSADRGRPRGWTSPPRPTRTSSPRAGFFALRSRLRHAAWCSRELVNWVRVIKSPAEQDEMRAAGAIADESWPRRSTAVTPGRRQCDSPPRFQHAQALGTPTLAGDLPRRWAHAADRETAGTPT